MSRPPAREWSSRLYRKTRGYRQAARALGLRVREVREKKGLTLEKASERADMDLTHWQKVEAGGLNPTFVTLLRVADGLGVDVGELFKKKQ